MKRFTMFACLALALAFALSSFAGDETPRFVNSSGFEAGVGGSAMTAKASRDTAVLIGPAGSGATVLGTFEDGSGNANWNGWTHYDVTQRTTPYWQASTFNAVAGVYSAWCGAEFAECNEGIPNFGYGNGWNEMLEWRGAVADNGLSCTVTVTASLRYDTEPGYDYTSLSYEKFDQGFLDTGAVYDDAGTASINEQFTYAPADYMGSGGDEVVVIFRVTSDGAWSNVDCLYESIGGACQLDDVVITLSNGTGYSHDFEDGTLGAFTVRFPVGVGDFAKIWTGLEDFDPCATNYTPQVAFIDDGVVVPGTGGTPCQTWCYGPSGWVHNSTGGLAGPESHLHDVIESPTALWQDPTHTGALLEYDVYRHEEHSTTSTGVHYEWAVRSTAGGDITTASWRDRNFVYYGGPNYFRDFQPVRDLLEPGVTAVQVQLGSYEIGYIWGYVGNDGTPHPYFDNVRFSTYPQEGPGLSFRELEMAQDNFPVTGAVDLVNLGANSVRFDMANNISLQTHERNDPGDSLVFNASVVRAGASFVGMPQMVWTMYANPLFDAYRTNSPGTSGVVDADYARASNGTIVPDRFFVDLPDTLFLFPGDIVHYYFTATDNNGLTDETATMPADLTGYGVFDPYNPLTYNSSFTFRALPTITEVTPGVNTQPGVLFWNDMANRNGQEEWHGALANLGLLAGRDYDVYYTNSPSSGVGNGIGGRGTDLTLENYDTMLYTAGNLSAYTISNGDFAADAGNDAVAVVSWLQQGGKKLFATGDDLATDLQGSGATTGILLEDHMGLTYAAKDVRPLINGQTTPRVLTVGGNPVFTSVTSWIAYGGCAGINTFDAVQLSGSAERLAEFANPAGAPGGYTFSAATLNEDAILGNAVITMPYDFMYIYTDANEAKALSQLSARARVLKDVLNYFGVSENPGDVTAVPGAEKFAVRNYPNPFNPKTTIAYTVKQPGHMMLSIYNIRGELVKTLIDGHVEASSSIEWDGDNNAGAKVSSGVYFFRAQMGNDVVVNKMALLK